MKETFYLVLSDGEELPETTDLLSLFEQARRLNRNGEVLPPRAAAIMQVFEDEKGQRKLVLLASYGSYRITRKGRPLKGGAAPIQEVNTEMEVEVLDDPEELDGL